MSEFFRKTGVKATAAVLCILSLTAGLIAGLLVMVLLSAGSYDRDVTPFTSFAQNQMAQDAHTVMMDYFDPSDPTNPWRSYYSGGVYTGEDSNFRYNITDDATGYSVLATIEGGEQVLIRQDYTYSFDVGDATAAEDTSENLYVIEDPVFECGDTIYAYDTDMDAFVPLDEVSAHYLEANISLDEDALTSHIAYRGSYYSYDGSDFVRLATPQETESPITFRDYTITCYILADMSASDNYRNFYELSHMIYSARYDLIAAAAGFLALGLALLVLLCCTVGRRPGQQEACLPPIFRLPSDLVLVLAFLALSLGVSVSVDFYETTYLTAMLAIDGLVVLAMAAVAVYCILQLCARAKTHTLVSGSLIYWVVHNIGRFFRWLGRWCRRGLSYLPLVWKVMVCYGLLCLAELLGIGVFSYGYSTGLLLVWFLEKLVLGVLVAYVALAFRRLKAGAETIARGDYNTKVDDKHLVLDFKDTADTLNHIQDGMNAAVDSRMKSERLKTELITNVSHDLKTPLTSIVSYVDLLKQEPIGSEAAGEYLEVLDRQSQRLKKLIEDLVEASKASTGNISVEKAPVDVGMLLGQALGEYSQRLEQAGLTPVLRLPEEPCLVMADGRLLWRVFDNLLGNIVKYAMPGTRVYLTLEPGDTVTAAFRNISREPLEVSAEELMERFVRGDASRHTEGSGLGLSIARSLTDAMGGSFALSLDGDLFKAMVSFPRLVQENKD